MGRVRRRKIDLLRREMKRIKKSFTREQWWWTITIARLYICNSIHPLMWTSFRPKCVYLTLKKKKKKNRLIDVCAYSFLNSVVWF